MKVKKQFLLLIACFLMFDLSGQSKKLFLDTVIIACNNQVQVKIATYNHINLKMDTTLTGNLYNLQKITEKIKDNVPDAFYKIVFNPGSSVILETIPPVNKYTISADSIVPFRQKNFCEIKTAAYDLYIFFEDIQGLLDPGIVQCVVETVHGLPDKSRFAWVYNYTYINGKGPIESQPANKISGLDMLNITPGIGAGLISGTFMFDVSLEVGLNFSKKGILKNSFYLSDDFVFLFGGYDFESSINNFINAGYRYNLSNKPDKKDWLGIEIGVPVMKGYHPLSDNLLRIGVKWDIGKSFWISGYLYVNKYNSVDPGLKIGFGF